MRVFYRSLKSVWGMFLGVALSAGSVSGIFSQTIDVQIGTQTGTTTNVPLTTNYGFSYSQQIYTVSDLNNAGITGPAEISVIRFYRTNGNLTNSLQWDVYLGNSVKTEFTSTTDWETSGNLQQVFSGTITEAGANEWQEITFSTPFNWDGVSNLIVAIDENQSNWGTLASWRKSDLGTNRSIYYRSDGTNPDPSAPPTANGRFNYVNNIQLVASPTTPCSGAPALTNIVSSEGSDVCEGSDFILSLEDGTSYFQDGITYQWQQFDGTNWGDISGETESTYTINAVTTSTDYQVVIGCSLTDDEVTLAPLSIVVHENPTVTVDIEESVVCPSTGITVTASGADTYSWAPSAGLSATNTATVDALPATATVYTVTGTDAYGCTATAQTTITPFANVSSQAVINPSELCEANVPVSITVSEAPEVVGGTWEYRFLGVDGITEVQPWNTTNVYNFIPSEDSVYTFYYQLRNSACTEALDSVKISVSVGFGSEGVAITNYDCNNLGGSASLINPFGQVAIASIYSNDFNAPADLSAFTLSGQAANTDGRLVLTPSATSISGNALLTVPDFTAGPNNSFSISFDLTADLPIDNWGTGGADGITYSFGDDATPTSNGSNQNGRGTKLRLSFDSAGNSSENNNQSGIYLVYGWTANNAFGPASSQTLAYSNNIALWKGQTDVPVVLTIDANGFAHLTVGGVSIFENIQMPAAYLNADVSGWNHLFSAGTGGDALRHAIDNLNIETGALQFGITQSSTATPENWQVSSTFTDLMPGTYYIWAAKDETAACSKMIETVVVENANPVVDLGADTTICAGETLILDAGNPGSSYVWSNSSEVSQTLEVSTSGTYTVYATAPNGCLGIGNINVSVSEAPSAAGIYRQGSYPNFVFSVLNPDNAATYDWNFGDGTILTNAPATVSHYYTSAAPATVTVTLSNDCGSVDISEAYGDLAIENTQLSGLKIYPNPATDKFTVSLDDASEAYVSVVSTAGSVVLENTPFSNQIVVNTGVWESGIYFVTVSANGAVTTSKVVVR